MITVTMGGMVTGMEGMARISLLRNLVMGMGHRVMAAMPVGMANSARVSALPCFSSACLVLPSWVIFSGQRLLPLEEEREMWQIW